MRFLFSLAWRDLRASGRHLWIFCACLVLGVALVAAGGGLYRQVADALSNDARLLFGGDVEVEHTAPLPADVLGWMETRGEVSRLVELRTMLRTDDGRAQLIELQSADAAYPLVGRVELNPAAPLLDPTAILSPSAIWGEGCYVNIGVLVGAACRFGRFVLVNRGAGIGHHAEIGAFVAIGPGAILAGQVVVGDAAMIGAGAVICPGIRIGAGAVVAPGAVVRRDVAAGTLVAGNPARAVRKAR